LYTEVLPFVASFVDNPEFSGLRSSELAFYGLGGLSIAALILLGISSKKASRGYLWVFLPLFVFTTTEFVSSELSQRKTADPYDKAAALVKATVPATAFADVLFVPRHAGPCFRSMVALDHADFNVNTLPPEVQFDLQKVDPQFEWAVVFGPVKLGENVVFDMPAEGFRLVRLGQRGLIQFNRNSWPGTLVNVEGLHAHEDWGAWSSGSEVILEFTRPLPPNFRIKIEAMAFGRNAEEPFHLQVGDN